MEYRELAQEYLQRMFLFHKASYQRKIYKTIRGENCVLFFIYAYGGAAPGEISSFMGISSARIAAVLNGLEKKGFIIRETDSIDHRRTKLSLTREGIAFIEKSRNEVVADIEKLFGLLGEYDTRELIRITDRIIGLSAGRDGAQTRDDGISVKERAAL